MKQAYREDIFTLPRTVFQRMVEDWITIPQADRTYPYFLTFDSELYFQSDCPLSTSLIVWEARHVPLSISVCSNMQGFTHPACFVNYGDPVLLMQDCVRYMQTVAMVVESKLRQHYKRVIDQLQDQLVSDIAEDEGDVIWRRRRKKTRCV